MDYQLAPTTRIGHVHLKVTDIDRSLEFYQGLLGFEITQRYGSSAVFLSAGGYHHHIGLNTWHSRGGAPASQQSAGLYHAAILYPTKKDLARAVRRIIEKNYPLTGAADHGVSIAVYLNDPDQNGIELYWDREKEQWPVDESGNLKMITEPLDLGKFVSENYSPS